MRGAYFSLQHFMLLLFSCMAACLFSEYAFAANSTPSPFNMNVNSCGGGIPEWMFTSRIVFCVKSQLAEVIIFIMNEVTALMAPTTVTLFALAVVFFGIQVTMGVKDITKDTMIFLLKFAIVVTISFNLADYALVPFGFVATLAGIVTATFQDPGVCAVDYQPWCSFDVYIGHMIGYGGDSPYSLQQGLLGIINTSLYSSLTGILVFVMGALSLLSLLYFALRAVYSYLAALIMIAYMMLLAPVIVPLAIFQLTEQRFFKKWLDLLVGAMINPVMVLAFLAIFLPTVQSIIDQMFAVLGGKDFSQYWRTGNTLLSWQVQTPPNIQELFNSSIGQDPNPHSSQGFMSPGMSSSMDIGLTDMFGADFGPDQVQVMQGLIVTFLGLFLTSYIMLSLLDGVPEIADGVAGVITGLRFEGMPFASELKQIMAKVRAAAGGAG